MPMSRIEDIANSIFPVLKKVGTLHISKDLSERMIERHLEKRLYMDYSSEGISIRINFVYGDMVFDPSKEKTGRVSMSEIRILYLETLVLSDNSYQSLTIRFIKRLKRAIWFQENTLNTCF